MKNGSSFKIKAENLSCFNQSVKLLYTGDGLNSINKYLNDRALQQLDMNTTNFGGSFLDASGRVWVADGKTLPHAFNSAVNVVVRYVVGATLYTTNLTTNVGEAIDAFFVRIAQDMSSQVPDGNNLDEASPMGVKLFYATPTECKMKPSMFNEFLAGLQIQDLAIPTTSFPATIFTNTGYPKGFKLKHPDGWNIDIIVSDVTSNDYNELVNSLLNQKFYIDEIRKYSNNYTQIEESILLKKYDVAGFEKQLVDTTVIDPYQYQSVIDYKADIVMNGQTYLQVEILAGDFLTTTIFYDKTAGVVRYEQIANLDNILREQGINNSNEQEEQELEEAFMNFSGFNSSKDEVLKLGIIGLITYLALKD